MTDGGSTAVADVLQKATDRNIPLNVLVELTYRCNLRCGHCYVVDPGGQELSTPELIYILDELAGAGALFLTLTGGEILVRRDWREVCRYARDANFAVRLFTNGTRIDDRVARQIAGLGVVDVGVSLYGANPETHDVITRVRGSFERTLTGLRELNEAGVRTAVKYLLMKHNVQEFERARELADEIGAAFSFSFYVGPRVDGSRGSCIHRVGEPELEHLLADGALYPEAVRITAKERTDLRGAALRNVPMCGAGRDTCAISPYGDLKPCAILPTVAGNLREHRFSELWRDSAELQRIRGAHMAGLKGCSSCRSLGYCGRCPAFALLEDGDMFGPSSFACAIERIAERSSGMDVRREAPSERGL